MILMEYLSSQILFYADGEKVIALDLDQNRNQPSIDFMKQVVAILGCENNYFHVLDE